MKAIFVVMMVFAMFFMGCTGDAGKDGLIYIRCTYEYSMVSWYFSASSVRYTNTYYQVGPGTYSWSYQLKRTISGSVWTADNWGNVSLTANTGEKGGPFFKKGKDGDTKHVTLNFGWNSAWVSKPGEMLLAEPKEIVLNTHNKTEFDATRPIITRVDTVDGVIATWKYQVQKHKTN